MIKTIQLDLLPKALRTQVLESYAQAIRAEGHLLTLEEAAHLYGYQLRTLRWYVYRKQIKSVWHKQRRHVRHADMRAYLQGRERSGRPRKALKNAQTVLA
jgi:hypothetical protein